MRYNVAGYLVNTPDGPAGEPGIGYNYILTASGVYLQAENDLLSVCIPIALARVKVRGLADLVTRVELKHGPVPLDLWTTAVQLGWGHQPNEIYLAVVWCPDGAYRLFWPRQQGARTNVAYHREPSTVVDIHTHPGGHAFFSSVDDTDERGLGIFAVIGYPNGVHEARLRVGAYGYYYPLDLEAIFR